LHTHLTSDAGKSQRSGGYPGHLSRKWLHAIR
jgi:hypothetical protein